MPDELAGAWKWRRLLWLVLVVVIVVADQISKNMALTHLVVGDPDVLIPGFMNWYLAFNDGAAFSFLSSQGGWQILFFTVLAILISLFLLFWLLRSEWLNTPSQLAISFIMGGALGNVLDRIHSGHVIDFIQIHYQHYYWPTFNVADSFVCVGAAILILTSLKRPNDHDKNRPK